MIVILVGKKAKEHKTEKLALSRLVVDAERIAENIQVTAIKLCLMTQGRTQQHGG